jgi:hypothetical protein
MTPGFCLEQSAFALQKRRGNAFGTTQLITTDLAKRKDGTKDVWR